MFYHAVCQVETTAGSLFFNIQSYALKVGETAASPPTGHVRHLALTVLQFFFCNSGNMTLLHIHQFTSHGNMRLVSQKQKH